MQHVKDFFADRRTFMAAGFLGCMLLWVILLYSQHMSVTKSISESKASGIASIAGRFDPLGQWIYRDQIAAMKAKGDALTIFEQKGQKGRKIIRKAALRLQVEDAAAFVDIGGRVAQGFGGFVVQSNLTKSAHGVAEATLIVSVPAERFEAAMDQLRSAAQQVTDVKTEAADVTKRFVDLEATLRSYRAEEAQYLFILKQAKKVAEIVLVTEKLLDVRQRIEQTEGEFRYLQNEIAMSTITMELYVNLPLSRLPDWQVSNSLKEGFESMLRRLTSFADGAIYLLFQLPVLGLWMLALWSAALGVFRSIRWVKHTWFTSANEPQV